MFCANFEVLRGVCVSYVYSGELMATFQFAAIFAAVSATRPRADVAYCIHALARRLSKTHNWAVCVMSINFFFVVAFYGFAF